MRPPRIIYCPICDKGAPYDPANAFRPFCSERCKLIDLGEWAKENYRLPDNEAVLPDESEI